MEDPAGGEAPSAACNGEGEATAAVAAVAPAVLRASSVPAEELGEDSEAACLPLCDEEASPRCGMHQPSSSQLDMTDAFLSHELPTPTSGGDTSAKKDAPCIVLPHQNDYVSHIALDIGGSLIKLVYFKMESQQPQRPQSVIEAAVAAASGTTGGGAPAARASRGGKLHFVKFETVKVEECIAFIEAKGLHRSRDGSGSKMRVKATGGGAYKYAELFKQRLGLIIESEDEMACMVGGCNFLLNAVRHEAFQYENGQMKFVDLPTTDHYPYLLVNIGSGVSMVRVDGEDKFQRVSGTNIGGGTFWGICKLLTGLDNFDDILALSSQGDNSNVDMLVGDIYGGRDYTGIGLSANTIASSFGKVINQDKGLGEYNPADMAMSLCRMISYNIGQLAYLNAKRYNLSRIFFGGFFIRGHPYTMETISFAIRFWSKGEMAAMFLRHEGFLGAVGAFMKVQALQVAGPKDARKVRARFVERFTMGAPVMGGEVRGPAITGLPDKISWVEKFVEVGRPATQAAKEEHERALQQQQQVRRGGAADVTDALAAAAAAAHRQQQLQQRISFHVGVLHYTPSSEPFPLLVDAVEHNPSTIDINSDRGEMEYWIGVLQDQIGQVVEKAAVSEGGTAEAQRRAAAFGRALDLHLTRLRSEPGAYGQLGLADLFELREECLREFGFADVYSKDKDRENSAALEVLPDLLAELDQMAPPQRLLALVQGVLAANIFDWGSKACVHLYQNATILEMYREARTKLSRRPWRVDDFDEFAEVWFSKSCLNEDGEGTVVSPYQRIVMFVDNAGADAVLGMLPFARELLRMGSEVVLVANSQPAINDITAPELRSVVAKAAEVCPIIRAARDAAVAAEAANNGHIPPVPGFASQRRTPSPSPDFLSSSLGSPYQLPPEELPAARSAAGFAFAPAPRRANASAVTGSELLGAPLPNGSPLADALSSLPGRIGSGSGLASSPSRRPPLPPHHHQQLAAAEQQRQVGGSGSGAGGSAQATVDRAIAALGATAPRPSPGSSGDAAGAAGAGAGDGGAMQQQAQGQAQGPAGPASADGAGKAGAAGFSSDASGAEDPSPRSSSSSSDASGGSGSGVASRGLRRGEERQLGGQRRRSPSVRRGAGRKGMFGESYPSLWRDPRLFIVASGHGSPCLDLRRVSSEVADAAVGTDLVVLEGMGRAVHTNYFTRLQCDTLKLAMIKNEHLARSLFKGEVYDCVCRFDEGLDGTEWPASPRAAAAAAAGGAADAAAAAGVAAQAGGAGAAGGSGSGS